ncbi:hypothetical protein GCM10010885_09830 [Alicyclobacillus cellulosilyticus]|uniref:Phosphodiester glycosidase domain-containing protein n=2 Tax=Alicyclobacillus cellulosilyticus TaxID=1003997 RepID=A0A917K683_9BACL|nr:hypothetical protein GCM10010885_09830 [Alicyclobacillus cellulosilyticus]
MSDRERLTEGCTRMQGMMRQWKRACVLIALASLVLGGTVSAQAAAGVWSAHGVPITPAGWPLVLDQSAQTAMLTHGVVQEADRWETTSGPIQINLLSVNLTDPNVKLGVVLANDRLFSPDETLTSMAARTGAVAGINGDFFELGRSGRPENLCIRDGVVLQSPLQGRYAVVGVTADGRVTIGPEAFSGVVTAVPASGGANPGGASGAGGSTGTSGGSGASSGSGANGGASAGGAHGVSNGGSNGASVGAPTSASAGTPGGTPAGLHGDPSGAGNNGSASAYPSFPLISVNRPGTEDGGQLGLITPAMGDKVYVKSDTLVYLTPLPASPGQSASPSAATGGTGASPADTTPPGQSASPPASAANGSSPAPTASNRAGTTPAMGPVLGQTQWYQVQRLVPGAKVVPQLTDQFVLTAAPGAAADWAAAYLKPGSVVSITVHLNPDDDLVQAVGAGYQVLKHGQWYDDPQALGAPNVDVKNPLTAVGVTRDGRHAFMVVADGRESNHSVGLTYRQMAAYLQQLGAWDAAVLDGGGSSEMVARLPGSQSVTVLNSPSDGWERRVANGLFVYSTETQPAPATQVVLNYGSPVAMLAGTAQTVPCYALDAAGNTAAEPVQLTVQPAGLARVNGNRVQALKPGRGQLIAITPSGASARVPLVVVAAPASVTVEPAVAALAPGQRQAFTITARTADGLPLAVPDNMVQWSVSHPGLGQVASGVLQASPLSGGAPARVTGQVTASVGGVSGSATVAVGYVRAVLDPLASLHGWAVGSHNAGRISACAAAPPDSMAKGALRLDYDFLPGGGVQQMVFWPQGTLVAGAGPNQAPPQALGMWVKGDGSGVQFAVSLTGAFGNRVTLYPFRVTFRGWRYVTVPLPNGLGPAVTVNFLDFLTNQPPAEQKGTLYVSGLAALYPPDPVSRFGRPTVPPPWFRAAGSPANFRGQGATFVLVAGQAGGVGGTAGSGAASGATPGANSAAASGAATGAASKTASGAAAGTASGTASGAMSGAAAGATDAAVWARIGQALAARQTQGDRVLGVQTLGDVFPAGALSAVAANATTWQQVWQRYGYPVHAAVGVAEAAGAPEDKVFRQAFGATHYTYRQGFVQWLVLDDAHGELAASDAHQVPTGGQLAWLAQQLAASTAKVVVIAANVPAYSPAYGDATPVLPASEAAALERFALDVQLAEPGRRVLLVFKGGSKFTVRCLNPSGQDDPHGVLNLYVPPGCVLLHITPDGQVQWAR